MAVNVKGDTTRIVSGPREEGPERRDYHRTASIGGVRHRPSQSPYAASKSGAIRVTKAFGVELVPITSGVNCINPSATETPMLPELGAAEEANESSESTIPMGGWRNLKILRMQRCTQPHTDLQWPSGLRPLDVDGGRAI